jgi:hypothetical protein
MIKCPNWKRDHNKKKHNSCCFVDGCTFCCDAVTGVFLSLECSAGTIPLSISGIHFSSFTIKLYLLTMSQCTRTTLHGKVKNRGRPCVTIQTFNEKEPQYQVSHGYTYYSAARLWLRPIQARYGNIAFAIQGF